MAKYEYEVTETKSIDVPNCPLCKSDDLHFWNYSRDDSMHGAAAGVKCNRCGHEVKVDGNELHLDWGEDCQRAAIREWKSQVAMYGKREPEVPPDVKELKAKYLEAGYSPDLATASAIAQADGDTATVVQNQMAFLDQKKKDLEAEALKKQPTLSEGKPLTSEEEEKKRTERLRMYAGLK